MDELTTARAAVAMLVIVATHLASARIERAAGPRLRMLLSVAGGVAIGYVFVGLLPKIGVFTAHIIAAEPGSLEIVQYRLYLLSLAGLLLYFAADQSRAQRTGGPTALLLHSVVFGGYNALIGYLIAHFGVHRIGYVPYVVVAAVMALHVFALNHQLRVWHGPAFDRVLRWLFAGAVVLGWLGGLLLPLSEGALAAWSSVLAGGILINVFTEELPRGRDGSVPAFLTGVAIVITAAVLFRSLSRGVL